MTHTFSFELKPGLEEDQVWSDNVLPLLVDLPANVVDIWQFCVTEMVNNVIDHSGGSALTLGMTKQQATVEIGVLDNGVGIFRKIQAALNLADERQAILELSKGKLTTDPDRHSGQGIFFTSRMLDLFAILSGGAFFSHLAVDEQDWILERASPTGDNGKDEPEKRYRSDSEGCVRPVFVRRKLRFFEDRPAPEIGEVRRKRAAHFPIAGETRSVAN